MLPEEEIKKRLHEDMLNLMIRIEKANIELSSKNSTYSKEEILLYIEAAKNKQKMLIQRYDEIVNPPNDGFQIISKDKRVTIKPRIVPPLSEEDFLSVGESIYLNAKEHLPFHQ